MGCLLALLTLVVIAVAAFFVLRPILPEIAARVLGFTPRGSTEAVFERVIPPTSVQIQAAVEPEVVTVELGAEGSVTLDNTVVDVAVGSEVDTGQQAAVVTFNEQELLQLCQERTAICANQNPQFQNPTVDLRPGGAVIFADVTLPELGGISQRAGVVLRLDSTGRQFEVAGVTLNGMLFDPPEAFRERIAEAERRGNELLSQLAVTAGGGSYTLSAVQIDETTISLILR
jgi:hypothetical protein